MVQKPHRATDTLAAGSTWPSLDHEQLVWKGGAPPVGPAAVELSDYGTSYGAAVPPQIAELTPQLDAPVLELAHEAQLELQSFDREFGPELSHFAPVLLRSEASSSSQIENLTASARQIFSADAGGKASRNAMMIARNTRALIDALSIDEISVAAIRRIHAVLMAPEQRHTPGEFRQEPVWIGKRAESPIGADYVAPDHPRVPYLLDDLVAFSRRRDMHPLVQLAIAHAQFETIHPFSDGNGRTGRALAQAMLRQSGTTLNVAVPVSAGLLASVESYHDALSAYRAGDPTPIVQQFSAAVLRAVPNGRQLAGDLLSIREGWRGQVKGKKGGARFRMLDYAAVHPVFTAEMISNELGIAPSNAYRDLRVLQTLSVLEIDPQHQGITLWRAPEVLRAVDDFAERSRRRVS